MSSPARIRAAMGVSCGLRKGKLGGARLGSGRRERRWPPRHSSCQRLVGAAAGRDDRNLEVLSSTFWSDGGTWFERGGGDICVYDVNGDGVPDVITSLNAHGPGLAWFEQLKDAGGNVSWKRHLIMGDPATPMAEREQWEETDKAVAFTELHALALAYLDGDGSMSIITGKRWWSHGYVYNENDLTNPPVLYRFKLVRKAGGAVEWVPALIDDHSGLGTQILTTDINEDGQPEILTTARKGTFVFLRPSYQGAKRGEQH